MRQEQAGYNQFATATNQRCGTLRYKINGRELETYPLADLLLLERRFKAEVDGERIAAGLQPRGGVKRILVRMP